MKLWPWSRKKIGLTVPGPSPWYLKQSLAAITTDEGKWNWDFYDGANLSGLTRLLSPTGQTVLFLDFNCYVQRLSKGRILIWYEIGRSEKDGYEPPRIVFTILSLPSLEAFEDHLDAATEFRATKKRIGYRGGHASVYEFSTTVSEGIYTISPPPDYRELKEQLVLADFGPKEAGSNHYDKMYRSIFALNFEIGEVSVHPQKWFNEGNYDFGYQWITRVQRERSTNQIVGEGIRLGRFRLDSSATNIDTWLHQDIFYHPERG